MTPRPFGKGQVIANCGAMGLDWERLSLSGYVEALAAHNTVHEAGGQSSLDEFEPGDRLRRFHRARSR